MIFKQKNKVPGEIKNTQLLLAITAGRTGTTFLAELLDLFPTVASSHEPEPNYVHVLRRVQSSPAAATDFLLNSKLPAIVATGKPVYAESSHLFCKGFFEPLINMGVIPDLILLRREPRKIAWSLLERHTVPERTSFGLSYLVGPTDPNTIPLSEWESLSDYQLCFWYALEIEKRQRNYAELLETLGGRSFDVTARELNDASTFIRMCEHFDLIDGSNEAALAGHAELSSKTHNANKAKLKAKIDFEKEEAAVWERIAYYEPALRDHVAGRYEQ